MVIWNIEAMDIKGYLKETHTKYIIVALLAVLLYLTVLSHYCSLQKSANISQFYTPSIVELKQVNSNMRFINLWLKTHKGNEYDSHTNLDVIDYHLEKVRALLHSINERLNQSNSINTNQKTDYQQYLKSLTESFEYIHISLNNTLILKASDNEMSEFNRQFDTFIDSARTFELALYDEVNSSIKILRFEVVMVFIGLIALFVITIPIFIKHQKTINNDRELLTEKEKQTKVSQQQLEYVIQAADLGYWDWEYETGYHIVNDRWLSMLGYTRADINNDLSDWSERIHSDDKDRVISIVHEHIKSAQPYTTDFRMKHKEGHWVWIQGSGAVVEYHPVSGQPIRLCGTHQDVSARKAFEMKLLQQATHDHLTGLMNRVEMEKTFEREFIRSLRYHHQISVFMVDVDYFKTVNDTYGHSEGDRVLKIIASTIKSTMRNIDIVARYGGEEFVVILPETSLQMATTLAKRLRMTIEDLVIDNIKNLTVSIGIDTLTDQTTSCYELLNNADYALYAAKDLGRNQVVTFSPEHAKRYKFRSAN